MPQSIIRLLDPQTPAASSGPSSLIMYRGNSEPGPSLANTITHNITHGRSHGDLSIRPHALRPSHCFPTHTDRWNSILSQQTAFHGRVAAANGNFTQLKESSSGFNKTQNDVSDPLWTFSNLHLSKEADGDLTAITGPSADGRLALCSRAHQQLLPQRFYFHFYNLRFVSSSWFFIHLACLRVEISSSHLSPTLCSAFIYLCL